MNLVKRVFLSFIGASLAVTPFIAHANTVGTPEPGIYLTEGGWGQLSVQQNKGGQSAFSIVSTSGNGRMCELQGAISAGWATLAVEGQKVSCKLGFSRRLEGAIEINAESDQCFSFCGMGATFEGIYLAVPPQCTNAGLGKSRKAFLAAYKNKDYAAAKAILEPAMKACSPTMPETEKGRMANDLAVTLHHLGDDIQCLKVLAPFSGLAKQSEDMIRSEHSPLEADEFVKLARPTRTNIGLCSSNKR